MGETKKTSLVKSFLFAFGGISEAVKKERNLKIHLFATFLVILVGLVVGLTRFEWGLVTVVVSFILAAEVLNSAIEGICDLLKEKLNLGYEETTFIRNASAGAVLLLAIASVILALLIFLPYIS